ncbi:hypothetical protein SAMN05444679_11415 [Variovorax sp. CF079]|nr:hypothetical protein SAMN05444679_11415 [Variovorax sp. CF079]
MTAIQLINPPGLYDPAPNGYSHLAIVPPGTRPARSFRCRGWRSTASCSR